MFRITTSGIAEICLTNGIFRHHVCELITFHQLLLELQKLPRKQRTSVTKTYCSFMRIQQNVFVKQVSENWCVWRLMPYSRPCTRWDILLCYRLWLKKQPTTNVNPERDFAMLDRLMSEKPNATHIALESLILFSHNQTSTWMQEKSHDEREKLLKAARSLSPLQKSRFLKRREKIRVKQ